MKDWDGVKGIIYNWYLGQIGQVALAEILAGQTNPSGKLPMSIERDFKDSPPTAIYRTAPTSCVTMKIL